MNERVVTRVLAVLGTAMVSVVVVLGLFVTGPDIRQGEVVRILYLHPAIAWVAYVAFGITTLASVLWMWPRTRSLFWDQVAGASAEIGVVCTALTLVLGSIWGRTTWGVWWTWDARTTSTALLLFMYLGVLALRQERPVAKRERLVRRRRPGRAAGQRHAHALHRHRPLVLEPGQPDIAPGHLQRAPQLLRHLLGGAADLLDGDEEVIALAARRVERQLLDAEVLFGDPGRPAAAGQLRREPGDRLGREQRAHQPPSAPGSNGLGSSVLGSGILIVGSERPSGRRWPLFISL